MCILSYEQVVDTGIIWPCLLLVSILFWEGANGGRINVKGRSSKGPRSTFRWVAVTQEAGTKGSGRYTSISAFLHEIYYLLTLLQAGSPPIFAAEHVLISERKQSFVLRERSDSSQGC